MKKKYIWKISIIIIFLIGAGGAIYLKGKNRVDQKMIAEYEKPKQVQSISEQYDVIVIGGEPEGVAAAVSAARNGANTLLIESREELGGLFTYGMLNFLDIPQGANGKNVSKGIFQEWHNLVGADNAFGILEAKAAFKKLIDDEPNITLAVSTEVIDSIVEGNKVRAVLLRNGNEELLVKGKTFIDATQDADFAAMSDVPFFIGGEDIGLENQKMAVTLMLHLKNIDWNGIKETAKSKKFGEADVTNTVAWGFSNLVNAYKPVEENTRLRGLNLVKIGDEYFINALQIFGIDGLDEASKEEAIEKGKEETKHILAYLRNEFPGFENAEVISYPNELYVRETRHILAEYQLRMSDVWTNKDHWDSIALGAYPVDVQAQTPHDYGYVVSSPKQYAIPFRSLVPKGIDGLLVVGRSAGFSSLAAGSARVVPTGMSTGEAAGAAAALSIQENVNFRELSRDEELIQSLRETLKSQGAYVKHFEIEYPYMDEWYDQSIQTLINFGLVSGGYNNSLAVDDIAKKHNFVNMLMGAVRRSNPDKAREMQQKLDGTYSKIINTENTAIGKEEAATIISQIVFDEQTEENGSAALGTLIDKGLLKKSIIDNFNLENDKLLNKEMYSLIAAVIEWYQ